MNIKSNRPSVEPLESRIAPARLIEVGLPNNPNDTDFNESPFVDLETATDPIATAVGKGVPGIRDTFYIRLSAGDVIELFRFGGGAATEPLLIVNSGNIVAFFTDKNLDNEVQEGEITGISMGKNASFELRAALPGDIVANLDERGTKDQADDTLVMGGPGFVPADFGIKSVKIGSSVGGFLDEGIFFQSAIESTPGGVGVQEVQDFSVSNGQSDLAQSFRISYGGYTTASLVVGSSELDVENALNALKTIKDAGEVVVTSAVPGEFTVTFKLEGDQPGLFEVRADHAIDFTSSEDTLGDLVTNEVQTMDIGLLAGQAGRLTFSFSGSSTVPLAFDATAQQVEDALNLLNSVSGVGGVSVTGPVAGVFTFTFNDFGDQSAITAHAEEFVTETVGGNILASGNISNIVVAGGVQKILAGSAADGVTFDFFPKYTDATGVIVNTPGGNGSFSFQPASGKAGSTIFSIIVDRLGVGDEKVGRIEAGKGGDGGKGGSINQIEIRRDADGFSLVAGDGGDSSLTKKKGGAGGGITKIYIDGAPDDSGNDPISIIAGDGGDSSTSTGGVGGFINNLYIGYRLPLVNGKPRFTDSPLRDNVFVQAGTGGAGKIGATGGSLTNLNITVSSPESVGDEVQILAGDGGDGQAIKGGRGGTGGSISHSFIQNVDLSPRHSMLIAAGSGGAAGANAIGAAGGALLDLNVTGRRFDFEAGDGSSGKTGGKGGSIQSLLFTSVDGVVTDTVTINSGRGGDGLAGKAGNGGAVSGVSLIDADLFSLTINDSSLGKGDGGDSAGSKGGLGGSVSNVKVADSDFSIAVNEDEANLYSVRAGDGGDGDKGGGVGGSLLSMTFTGIGIEVDASAGDGGDALIAGAGGKAGSITKGEFSAQATVYKMVAGVISQVPANSSVRAGTGGDGAGSRGAGGLGGSIATVNIDAQGSVTLAAGDGGSGAGAAPGKGGNIHYSGLFATSGDANMAAGDGGAGGTRPAAGGSITGISDDLLSGAFAAENVTVKAGDGSNGGAGGTIKFFGYGSTASALLPTPFGDINILGGNGSQSGDGRYVGAGGSIINVNGSVSFNKGTTTLIQAGAGGSTPKKGGAGGSVTNLSLQRGGNPGVELEIIAGDAGDAPSGNTGAKGGSVNGVTVIDLSESAVLRHITAGDGGDAIKKGGVGGSVTNVNVVNHDIGLRRDVPFGYDSMGGIFAGAGGVAATKGIAGNVTGITADAIGSIVAGRGTVPELVNKVESIYLNDSNLLIESEGAFEPNGVPGIKEEQRFTPSPGLPFQLEFAGEKTVILSANSTRADVEAALNNIATIDNAGGVSVTQAVGSESFKITFNEPGDRPAIHFTSRLATFELVRGAFNPPIFEVQSVRIDPELFKGIYASFGFGFGPSAFFPDASLLTATSLEAGLDGIVFGGVTVTAGEDYTFQITFDAPLNQSLIHFDADRLPSALATEVRDGADPSKIVFINGSDRTAPLDKNAAPGDVANAINALPSIMIAGGVSAKALLPNGYRIEFNTPGNNPQITAEEVVIANAAEELAGELNTELKVIGLVEGDAAKRVQEVQTVQIDSKLLGSVTVNFGDSATSFKNRSEITAANLEVRLNLLTNIAAVGGVTVAALPDDFFQITFNQPGDRIALNFEGNDLPLGYAIQTGDGTFATQEIQKFTVNPSVKPLAGFQISFGADATNFLVTTSTATEVQDALNSLPSIIDAGGVTVAKDSTVDNAVNETQTFTVTFNQVGNQEPLYVLNKDTNENGITLPLFGTSTRAVRGFLNLENLNDPLNAQEVQFVTADPVVGGFFYLTFGGFGTVGIKTPVETSLISLTTAYELSAGNVQNTLNALPSIEAAGGVTVDVPDGTTYYKITFNAQGAQPLFVNTAIQVPQILTETIHGVDRKDALEVQSIVYNPDGRFNVTFPVSLFASEDIQGSTLNPEEQVLDLRAVEAIAGASFVLKFGTDTTGSLNANATDSDIQMALNALGSVTAAGGVTVTEDVAGIFRVVFGNPVDQLDVITGSIVSGSQQTVEVNGSGTPEDVALALQTALNNLSSIAAGGGVTVAVGEGTNTLNVIFNTIGKKPSLTAVSNVNEIQSIALYSAGEYEFTYGANKTLRLPAGSTPADVQAALNGIAGFPAGGVTVTNGLNNDFTFTFNESGDFESIKANQYLSVDASTFQEGTASLREKQDINQPQRYLFVQSKMVVASLVGGISDSTDFDPHIFKWTDTNSNGLYDLGEIPTDGIVMAKNYNSATTSFIPEARFVGGDFTFTETTQGAVGIAEVETFTIRADRYTLAFGGDQTAQLSGKSKAATVAKALNALPSIISAGGVNVTSTAANTFTVTFNSPGARDPILAPFFYDFNNILH